MSSTRLQSTRTVLVCNINTHASLVPNTRKKLTAFCALVLTVPTSQNVWKSSLDSFCQNGSYYIHNEKKISCKNHKSAKAGRQGKAFVAPPCPWRCQTRRRWCPTQSSVFPSNTLACCLLHDHVTPTWQCSHLPLVLPFGCVAVYLASIISYHIIYRAY